MSISSASLVPTLPVNGIQLLNPSLQSVSLSTDALGNIVAGTGPTPDDNYSGKASEGVIVSGQNDAEPVVDYFTEPTDSSLISVDFTSRICTIQLNYSGKMGQNNLPNAGEIDPTNLPNLGAEYSMINISASGQNPTAGDLPEPSSELTYGVFTGGYYDISNPGNNQNFTWFWWYDTDNSLIRLIISNPSSIIGSEGDTVIINGTFSYIF